jgi:hypothetical protein
MGEEGERSAPTPADFSEEDVERFLEALQSIDHQWPEIADRYAVDAPTRAGFEEALNLIGEYRTDVGAILLAAVRLLKEAKV